MLIKRHTSHNYIYKDSLKHPDLFTKDTLLCVTYFTLRLIRHAHQYQL